MLDSAFHLADFGMNLAFGGVISFFVFFFKFELSVGEMEK